MLTRINMYQRGAVCEFVSGQADPKMTRGNRHPQSKGCIVLRTDMRPILT